MKRHSTRWQYSFWRKYTRIVPLSLPSHLYRPTWPTAKTWTGPAWTHVVVPFPLLATEKHYHCYVTAPGPVLLGEDITQHVPQPRTGQHTEGALGKETRVQG